MGFDWAVVHTVTPLTVKKGANSNALLVIQSLVDPSSLTVGDMVRVELAQGGRVVVYGLPGGAGVPAGNVSATARVSAPAGWLLCDGSAVSRSTYEVLFTAISTTYGAGDGTTTFNVPNLKGRVPLGVDSGQTEFDTLGETGGAKTHTLTVDESPSHIHGVLSNAHTGTASEIRPAALNRGYPDNGLGPDAWVINIDQARKIGWGRLYTTPVGGDDPHNNLQPYIALNYIIKA